MEGDFRVTCIVIALCTEEPHVHTEVCLDTGPDTRSHVISAEFETVEQALMDTQTLINNSKAMIR